MAAPLPDFVQAAKIVYEYASKLLERPHRTERIPLEAACGRILAEAIRADRDMPAFPRSTRDGFAVRASEFRGRDGLAVAGSVRAGESAAGPLPADAAWEIMTGAAVPADADAVVMLEHVENADGRIRLAAGRSIEAGENIVPRGAEARRGDELVASGARLHAAQIAAAAACGYALVDVFARPTVAILTTGDELVSVDASPGPSQIRNSNASMLAALVTQAGGEPRILPTAVDEAGAIEAALRVGMEADLLLISGGVSAGKFDLVEPALARMGAQFHFTGVRIQPGKPLVFGEIPQGDGGAVAQPFFGHPGNPISTAATFLLFAAPVLRGLAGAHQIPPTFGVAVAAREVKGKPDLTRFVPARFDCDLLSGTAPEVAPVPWQGSGDLAAFARANCFLVVPEGGSLVRGDVVRILPI